jgi:hypothetical protein
MAGDLNKAIAEYEWLRAVIEGWPFDPLEMSDAETDAALDLIY